MEHKDAFTALVHSISIADNIRDVAYEVDLLLKKHYNLFIPFATDLQNDDNTLYIKKDDEYFSLYVSEEEKKEYSKYYKKYLVNLVEDLKKEKEDSCVSAVIFQTIVHMDIDDFVDTH